MTRPPSRSPEHDLPPDLLLWRRVSGFVPWWTWVLSAVAVLAATLPFWLHSSPAPYHDFHGDVSRGWPAVYGLDQGDVGGDEWGPFVTDFRPGEFALDTALGVICNLPAVATAFWLGRRFR